MVSIRHLCVLPCSEIQISVPNKLIAQVHLESVIVTKPLTSEHCHIHEGLLLDHVKSHMTAVLMMWLPPALCLAVSLCIRHSTMNILYSFLDFPSSSLLILDMIILIILDEEYKLQSSS
jgi:hypothetical protein